MRLMRLTSIALMSGLIAIAIGWTTIIVTSAVHPCFSIFKNALSDLGALDVPDNYIFNVGITLASIFALIHGVFLVYVFKRTTIRLSGALLALSALFLMLIALYPEGTSLHYPFSIAFFALLIMAMLLNGISIAFDCKLRGLAIIVMSFLSIAVGFLPWPSTCMLEIMVLIFASIWILLSTIHMRSIMMRS